MDTAIESYFQFVLKLFVVNVQPFATPQYRRCDVRQRIVEMAFDTAELSPRELAAHFTVTQNYFVSEPSVHRLLKAHDLITSPAFIVINAADELKDKTTAINQLWQTDFTCRPSLSVTGRG